METADRPWTRDRLAGAGLVALVHLALGYALVTGLGVRFPAAIQERIRAFDVTEAPPPPEPPPVPPPERRSEEPEGAAAPPNIRSRATSVVVPPPEVRLPPPPPTIVAAPVANLGSDATQGAADRPGPGTGAGGEGQGTGSGGSGDGTGAGGGRPARWIAGRLRPRDYPPSLVDRGIGGTVGLRFVVAASGRVRDCRVTRSSGSRLLDSTTCRLIEARLRYRPARDGRGRAVEDVIEGEHVWEVGPEPPPVEYEADIPE